MTATDDHTILTIGIGTLVRRAGASGCYGKVQTIEVQYEIVEGRIVAAPILVIKTHQGNEIKRVPALEMLPLDGALHA